MGGTKTWKMIKLKELISLSLHTIGFDSWKEIFMSPFAIKHKIFGAYIVAVSVGGLITGVQAWTEKYIYSPAIGLVILWVLAFMDIVLGMSVAIGQNNFQPAKIGRASIRVLFQTVLIAVMYHITLTWPYLLRTWMVDSFVLIFIFVAFWSVIQNAYTLGIMDKETYQFLQGLINIKNIIKWIKRK